VEWWKDKGFEIVGFDGLGKIRGIDISNTPTETVKYLIGDDNI